MATDVDEQFFVGWSEFRFTFLGKWSTPWGKFNTLKKPWSALP